MPYTQKRQEKSKKFIHLLLKPDPRQVEDVLHDHCAADQDRQLQADQGDYRYEGIFGGVPDHNEPLLEPIGPGGADIVLPEHLQPYGARHPHRGGRIVSPKNQAGNDEHPETAQRIFREGNHKHRERPTPPDGREDHHHHAQPEIRSGQADDGEGAPQVVGDGILANRRVDAHGQRDQEPDNDGHQPQHTLQRFTVYITRRVLQIRQHGVDHIPWQQANREKDDEAQDQQGGDDQQYPPDDIGSHGTDLILLKSRFRVRPASPFSKGGLSST